ncbi:MAG: RNase adapter RapZ [Thiotrichaceae bacterium]|nr:RNase adapter RapZ [Thiotrichaceae bacterium]
MNFVIVSGLSGSGKTMVLNTLEDHGYYCIDNLPIELLSQLYSTPSLQQQEKVAIGIDVRNSKMGLHDLPHNLKKIHQHGHEVDLIFLHAEQQILLKRYNETRRKHPLSNASRSLPEALELETKRMEEIRSLADLEIDTTYTNIYQLAGIIRQRVCSTNKLSLSLMFQSFGYKHGIPTATDFMFDVRCLPNPYWVNELRQYNGTEKPIIDWLGKHDEVKELQKDISQFLEKWIPSFLENQRSYLTISIGCTGGRHRSVYLCEQLTKHFNKDLAIDAIAFHRESH